MFWECVPLFHKRTWPKFSLLLNWIEANFQWQSGDLKKKKRSSPKSEGFFLPKSRIQTIFPANIRWSPKKKVFAEIRRLFLAEIKNLNGFSDQKQKFFHPINQHSNLDGRTPKSQWGTRNLDGGTLNLSPLQFKYWQSPLHFKYNRPSPLWGRTVIKLFYSTSTICAFFSGQLVKFNISLERDDLTRKLKRDILCECDPWNQNFRIHFRQTKQPWTSRFSSRSPRISSKHEVQRIPVISANSESLMQEIAAASAIL